MKFAPLGEGEWSDAAYDAFGVLLGVPGDQVPRAGSGERYDPLNFPIIGSLAHHPALAKAFLRFNNFHLFKGELPARLRELAIMRVAATRRSAFEYGEHVRIGTEQAGITLAEVELLEAGNAGFAGADLAALEAADELLATNRIADWDGLVELLGVHEAIELIFVVGTYNTLAMALDTWDVPAAADARPLPAP